MLAVITDTDHVTLHKYHNLEIEMYLYGQIWPKQSIAISCLSKVLQYQIQHCAQYASAPCKLTISSHLFARWHLFRHLGYLRHQQQVDL